MTTKRLQNRCWSKERIQMLILAVNVNNQRNITQKVAKLVDILSKWHTKLVIELHAQPDDAVANMSHIFFDLGSERWEEAESNQLGPSGF